MAVKVNGGRQTGDMTGKIFNVNGQCRDPSAESLRADAEIVDLFQNLFFESG